MVRSGNDYGGLGAIIDEGAREVRFETDCPNHGEPLDVDEHGVRNCPFGDYRVGVRTPHVPTVIVPRR